MIEEEIDATRLGGKGIKGVSWFLLPFRMSKIFGLRGPVSAPWKMRVRYNRGISLTTLTNDSTIF